VGSSTILTVRMPVEMKQQLENLSRSTGRSKSRLAAEAIQRYVELEEWQVMEIQAGIREADAGDFASNDEVKAVFEIWLKVGRENTRNYIS